MCERAEALADWLESLPFTAMDDEEDGFGLAASTIRTLTAQLKEARATIPTCIITGVIPGEHLACGDCDPCGAAYRIPEPVKRLIAECNEWAAKAEAAESSLSSLRERVRADLEFHFKAWETSERDGGLALEWEAQERLRALMKSLSTLPHDGEG